MIPELSVVYNSLAANGMLGMGWTLGGISAITRESANLYYDGFIDDANFDSNDRFAYNGNRLILFSGSGYGQNGAEYRAETDPSIKIISNGMAGNGPVSFTVWTKGGIILEFGATTDSRVKVQSRNDICMWFLSKVSDTKGNYMSYTYQSNTITGEFYIDEIRYTGNVVSGLQPYNTIKFNYGKRRDQSTDFRYGYDLQSSVIQVPNGQGGTTTQTIYTRAYYSNAVLQTALLTSIVITNEGLPTRRYCFNYNFDRFSHLSKVTEFGSDGIKLNETLVNYHEATAAFSVQTFPIDNSIKKLITGDFNGDGKTDFVELSRTSDTINWQKATFYTASGNTFLFTKGAEVGLPLNFRELQVADIDKDGKDDLYIRNQQISGNRQYAWQCTGGYLFIDTHGYFSFRCTDSIRVLTQVIRTYSEIYGYFRGLDFYTNSSNDIELTETDFDSDYSLRQGDFDGNGETDFVVFDHNKNVKTLRGINRFPDVSWASKWESIDLNGNGKTDIMAIGDNIVKIFELGVSNQIDTLYVSSFPAKASGYKIVTGDFNGDGKTDLLTFQASEGWKIRYSTGIGFGNPLSTPILSNVDPEQSTADYNYFVLDINADGKDDIIEMYLNRQNNTPVSTTLNVFYGNGKEFFNETTTLNMTSIDEDKITFGDVNGDGIQELIRSGASSEPLTIVSFHPNEKRHLVQKITDGYNNQITFNYLPMTDLLVYKEGSGAIFPLADFCKPTYLVRTLETSNGIGGTASTDYFYEGLKIHRQGRGVLGFMKTIKIDRQLQIKTMDSLEIITNYYYLALKKSVTMTLSGTSVSETNLTNSFMEFGNKRFFPYVNHAESTDKLKGNTVVTDYTFDSYGNVLTAQTNVGGVYTNQTSNEYIVKGAWCPAKVWRSSETNIRAGASHSRTSEFQYDDYGLLTQQQQDPGQQGSVTTSFINHPVFGIPVVQIVSASGLLPQTDSLQYDAKFRFPVKTKNTLGFTSEITYDTKTGKSLTTKDANNLITTFTYDGFGRPKTITAPTGKTATSKLRWFDNTCPANTLYYSVDSTQGKAVLKEYFDRLGRSIRKETQGFDGRPIFVDTRYNAKGQVEKVSEPYFSGDTPVWTTFTYDAFGRTISVANPSATMQTAYNGNSITSTNTTTQQTTTKTYNAADELISATDAGGTISYEYYPSKLLKKITAPGGETNMEYDLYGNRTKLTEPSAGQTTYTYDTFGRMIAQTDANGKTFTFQYDKLNRVIRKTGPDGTYTNTYDTSPNGKGQLARETGPNSVSVSYFYDSYRQLSEKTDSIDNQQFSFHYLYNTDGNITKIFYPSGFAVTRTYNNYGFLLSVNRADNNALIWRATRMNAKAQYEQYTFGNGLVTTKTYEQNFPKTVQTGTFQNCQYTFSYATGNLTSRNDAIGSRLETFGYDNLDRLSSIRVNNLLDKTMSYDNWGRLTSKTDAGNYEYNSPKPFAVSQITGSAGNISDSTQTLTYTPFNKVASIREGQYFAQFRYGTDQERRKMILYRTHNQYTVLPSQGGIGEPLDSVLTSTSEAIEKIVYYIGYYEQTTDARHLTRQFHYIAGGEGRAAVYILENGVGTMYYLHKDHLGSICYITNQAGTLIQEIRYDAWGSRTLVTDRTRTGQFLLSRGFTGHEHLDEFRLINMNGRMYDPVLGQFLSPDNYVQMPDFTQNFNRYSYALNNPLKYTDPSGNWFKGLKKIIKTLDKAINGVIGTVEQVKGVWDWTFNGANMSVMDPTINYEKLINAMKIDIGEFMTLPTERIQGDLGNIISHFRNLTGSIDDVHVGFNYVLVNDLNGSGWGLTLGTYINAGGIEEDYKNDPLFVHEFGHTIQSKVLGFSYIKIVGLPSLLSGILDVQSWNRDIGWNTDINIHIHENTWFEITANQIGNLFFPGVIPPNNPNFPLSIKSIDYKWALIFNPLIFQSNFRQLDELENE